MVLIAGNFQRSFCLREPAPREMRFDANIFADIRR
jgi:hypothetical protein